MIYRRSILISILTDLFHDLWRRLTESEKKDVVSSTQFLVDLIKQKAFEIHKNIYQEIRAIKRKQAKPSFEAQNQCNSNRFLKTARKLV